MTNAFKITLLSLFILVLILTQWQFNGHNHLKPLRVGINDWCGYNVVLYGIEKGLFAKRGLEINLFSFHNLQDSARAMVRGSLDITFSTLWDIMQVDPGNDYPAILMVTNISHGSDGILAQKEIKSVAELKGKKVAAKLGTINHLILLEALKLYNISPKEVSVVDISNENAVEKMSNNQIDAAVLWEPLLSETASLVKGNIIYNTKEQNSLVIDLLASRSSLVAARNQELTQFILGWFDIMEAINTNPHEVFAVVAKKLGISADSFALAYAGLIPGDLTLNQKMFAQGNLIEAKKEITDLLHQDLRHSRIIREDVKLEKQPLMTAVKLWNK